METGELRERLVERRWLVVLVTGLALIIIKRAIEWPEPLVPTLLLYIVVPLLLAWLLRFRPADIGLAVPEGGRAWAMVGLLMAGAVAFALAGTRFPKMLDYYPVEHWGSVEPTAGSFLPYQAAMAVVMLGVELLYRGWLVLGTRERLGRWAAVVSAVPYALAHVGKPTEEVVFSLFAGIVFGIADLEARSILPSWAAHLGGSALFDWLALTS